MPKVDIPEEHYEAFRARADEKGFDSAEDYVLDVLEQVYEKLQGQEGGGNGYTEEEEKKVKERLRGLGYLD